MSDTPTPIVFDLFFPPVDGKATVETSDAGREIFSWLRTKGVTTLWSGAQSEVQDQLHEILHPSLGRILGGAWNAHREVSAMLEATRDDPTRTECYRTGAQKLEVEFEPVLSLTVNGAPTGADLRMTVKLSVEVETVQLSIRHGRVMALEPGECRVQGELKVGTAVITAPRRVIDLPGRIQFDGGIPC